MYPRQFVTLFGKKSLAAQITAIFAARTLPTWRYEAWDFAANYQDSAGTIPVTALEQLVGKRIDKSGRGNHSIQSTSASRPVASAKRNLLLASDTLATQSVSVKPIAHTLTFTGTGTVTLTGTSTAGPLVGTGAGDRVSLTFTPTTGSLTLTVSGSVTLAQLEYGAAFTRYQRTGSRNLLIKTEDFMDATWVTGNMTVTAPAVASPVGLILTSNLLVPTVTDATHLVRQSKSGQNSNIHSYYVKSAGYSKVGFKESGTTGVWAAFNLATGVVIASSATATIVDVGGGWFRVSMVAVTSNAAQQLSVRVLNPSYTSGDTNASTFAGDGFSGVYVSAAQMEVGDTTTAYQKVDTVANNYDAVGFPIYYAADGVDDGWYTAAAIDGAGSDKVGVFTAVTKLSDAAQSVLCELSVDSGSNNGTFAVLAPSGAAGNDVQWTSKGTTGVNTTATGHASPKALVIAATGDIGGDSASVDVNGIMTAVATDQGTGNYGSYVLYSMRRNNTNLPFNGRMAAEMGGFGSWSAGEIALIKQYIANLNAGSGA